MDQSRSRDQARYESLIIERPDLAHPLRRVSAVAFTALAWLLWLGMWLPLLSAIARHYGFAVREIAFPSHISLDSFLALLGVVPWAIGAALSAVCIAYLIERLKAHPTHTRHPVGIDNLATGAALDPEKLAGWQRQQVLYVEHGPRGRVTNAHTAQPSRPD